MASIKPHTTQPIFFLCMERKFKSKYNKTLATFQWSGSLYHNVPIHNPDCKNRKGNWKLGQYIFFSLSKISYFFLIYTIRKKCNSQCYNIYYLPSWKEKAASKRSTLCRLAWNCRKTTLEFTNIGGLEI